MARFLSWMTTVYTQIIFSWTKWVVTSADVHTLKERLAFGVAGRFYFFPAWNWRGFTQGGPPFSRVVFDDFIPDLRVGTWPLFGDFFFWIGHKTAHRWESLRCITGLGAGLNIHDNQKAVFVMLLSEFFKLQIGLLCGSQPSSELYIYLFIYLFICLFIFIYLFWV